VVLFRTLLVGFAIACRHQQPQAPAPTPPHDAAPVTTSGHGWLGVRFEPGTTRVVQVVDGSPAKAAGLHVDDEIASLDGVAVQRSQEIVRTVAEAAPGSTITIVIQRAGQQLTVPVVLATRPPDDKLMRDSLLDRPAPAFATTYLDGAPLALADLRGQVVLLDFWATWCGPCTTQYPHLNHWHAQYASKGLRIVALSDEEPDLVRDYAASQKLAYPIALDPDDKVRAVYFVPGMPSTVIIDRAGVVRYVAVGVTNPVEIDYAITTLLK
jgi:peroxiredoxin